MHLYELTKELQQLQDQLYGIAPELLPDEIEARIDQFGAQFEYKAEQIARMVRNLKADAESLAAGKWVAIEAVEDKKDDE